MEILQKLRNVNELIVTPVDSVPAMNLNQDLT